MGQLCWVNEILPSVDPDEFLDYVHNADFSKLKKNDELNQYLKLLPGKKIVFTNGDENYASKSFFVL